MDYLRSALQEISKVWKASWLGKIAILIGSLLFFSCCCIAAVAAIPGDSVAVTINTCDVVESAA